MTSLFEPVSFRCGAVAQNRVALAPLTNTQSGEDGVLSDDERRWLVRRAVGGFAVVETCAAHVSQHGKGFEGQLGIWSDRHVEGLRSLATAIAEAGALGVVQLYHGGVRSPSRLTGVQPISASSFREDDPAFEVPREATEADIEQVIADFEAAAKRAARAGFAGVELHGAHGYLLSQFLSRTMNQRTDAWGGPIEGRARLVRSVAQRVRAAVPATFLVGVRLSPEDYGYAKGLDLDETIQVARWLADDGVDWIHLSLWDATRNTKKRPTEHAVPLVRAALPAEVRIVAAGKVWTREDAEALVAKGADMVALGRAAILNPDWPKRAAEPGFSPERGPLRPDELAARDVGPRFVQYLRRFRLVAE
jgi:2,4-dienoyl-CoA reductase-like NADH-dependent reductase (Old Yellow Enzyme family)